MIEIGRVAMKIAGREAGRYCVILEKQDKNFVLVDGDVKRKRCNIDHLKILPTVLKIKKSDSKETILNILKKSGFVKEIPKKREKPKEKKPKPKKKRKIKEKKPKKKKKKKKEEPKKEEKKDKEK